MLYESDFCLHLLSADVDLSKAGCQLSTCEPYAWTFDAMFSKAALFDCPRRLLHFHGHCSDLHHLSVFAGCLHHSLCSVGFFDAFSGTWSQLANGC